MSCCSKCKPSFNGPRVDVSATIPFNSVKTNYPELAGKNFDLTYNALISRDGYTPKGGFPVTMTQTQHGYMLSVYKQGQPFNTLLHTLQIDTSTGDVITDTFWVASEFSSITLEFTKDEFDDRNYQQLAKGVYRVINPAGLKQVVLYKMSLSEEGKLSVFPYLNDSTDKRPVDLNGYPRLVVEIDEDNVLMRSIDLPAWKNDAGWK